MESVSEKCTPLKTEYDDCFNKWFSDEYLAGKAKKDCVPCAKLFNKYVECVKEEIVIKGIKLDMDETILGTEREKKPLEESR